MRSLRAEQKMEINISRLFIKPFRVFWSWFIIPAFYYHKAAHILIAYLTLSRINWGSSKFINQINRDKTVTMRWAINIDCNNLTGLLILIAPVIFWALGYILLVVKYPLISLYFLVAVKVFWLSEKDWQELKRITSLKK